MPQRKIVLTLLTLLVLSANIWGVSVYVLDEAKNSGCAMEMYQRNDWIVPTFNGELRTDKPPLHYYFMRTAYALFGVSPFSARLFSVVMGILTIFSVYHFSRKLSDEQSAFITTLILVSSVQLVIQFHLAVPDPYLIFFLTFSLLSFYYGFVTGKRLWFFIFYGSLGLSMMAKGPVAIVFAGLVIAIFLLVVRRFAVNEFMRMQIIPGMVIFLLIVLPWYRAVGGQTDGLWLEQFFFKHNVGRFTETMEGHRGFPLMSLVIVIVALIPFSFFLPQAIRYVWHVRKENPFLVFCLIVVSVVVIFFAFSQTILPNYPEPAVPFMAILLGYYFSKVEFSFSRKTFLWSAFLYLIVACAIPMGVWFAFKQDKSLRDLAYLSFAFLIFPVGALWSAYFIYKSMLLKALYTYAASAIGFCIIFFYFIFPVVDSRNPVTQSLPILKKEGVQIVSYKDFNPAYVLALERTIQKLQTPEEVAAFASHTEDFYIISQKRYWPELEGHGFQIVFEGKDLFEKRTTIVLKKINDL